MIFSRFLAGLFRRTLNSVWFGILLMGLTAAYIAVGSGLPEVREFFEMNELMFFSAWPLKALMVLLVLNLVVVSATRIPLTPPRYGVWMVHAGIIILIGGLSAYYAQKVEGLARVDLKRPGVPYRPAEVFYDQFERMLYVRAGTIFGAEIELPDLPRFKSYEAGSSRLASMREIEPKVKVRRQNGGVSQESISTGLGPEVAPIKLEVVGYYPYAEISSRVSEGTQAGDEVGVVLETVVLLREGASRMRGIGHEGRFTLGGLTSIEFEHRNVSPEILGQMAQVPVPEHVLRVSGASVGYELEVVPGGVYAPSGVDYAINVDGLNESFPMSGTGEMVSSARVLVYSGGRGMPAMFWRMVGVGKAFQTDFTISPRGDMGQRQKTPFAGDLAIRYDFADPFSLYPTEKQAKYTYFTSRWSGEVVEVMAGPESAGPVRVQGAEKSAARLILGGVSLGMEVRRSDRLHVEDVVTEVPPEKRNRDVGAAGVAQVLMVRVKSGKWSTDVAVPFSRFAMEDPWRGREVWVPGAFAPLRMQLGNTFRPMPAKVTLDRFELTQYPGGELGNTNLFRDFISHVTLEKREPEYESGPLGRSLMWAMSAVWGSDPPVRQDKVHLNNPIYYDGGNWAFYQAQWDPDQRAFTVLGVGNRPGTFTMTAGSVLIGVGLLYAFYVKPIIIRRMKAKAIAEAKKREPAKAAEPVLASAE